MTTLILFIIKLIYAFIGLAGLYAGMFLILRIFDNILGTSFKETFNIMKESPRALALYYGCRVLGVSIAVGLVLCFSLIL